MIISGAVHPSITTNLLKSLADPDIVDLSYALAVFRRIPRPSNFQWNTIIRACSRNQVPQESVALYREMCREGVTPDVYTFQFLFKACSQCSSIREGQTVHGNFLKLFDGSDIFARNSLIHMYSELGHIEVARRIFDGMDQKNVVSWTMMVGCYAKIGCMDEARSLFDQMPERNVVSWTSMIASYVQIHQFEEAVGFFKKMVSSNIKPDVVAMVSVLSACSHLRELDLGKWVHHFVSKERIGMTRHLAVALIDMYAKCGDMDAARQVFDSMGSKVLVAWNAIIDGYCKLGKLDVACSLFDQMGDRDLVTFNSMITGYVQNSSFKDAFLLFSELWHSGLKPDNFMIVSLLSACANLGALYQGKMLHAYIEQSSAEPDVFVGTALVDMYAKCGLIGEAKQVFNIMPNKDVLAWTVMISGLALHGDGKSALDHFLLMREEGIRPNRVTYVAVLSACSHSGLVEEGYFHFNEMVSIFNIEPQIEHYGCMVDLLGRSGYLKDAERLIQSMPVEPNAVIWGSLLGSCRVYNDVELAEKAAKNLLVLEPQKDAIYILLYNIYNSTGRWSSAVELRGMMEGCGIRKLAGCSTIVIEGIVHEFIAGDRSHPQFDEIQTMMSAMATRLKLAGHVPRISQVSLDIDEEEKENILFNHSEKMAIAFGILKLGKNIPIHILKNLRVCRDCHSAIKLIAKIWNREIVVRDRSRFHHFRQGQCSCGDFW
ncbi:PREDICTED: pentatricopeptide repeat-containing protein At1g08070, chloroplastic-like [Nelumbo nucifera]|uniref:Pentatricopeptide repeat-containing protein At1g08070, chloroplastic-like n=1 Tax=Nelumbo nucifera TaxID=4432 RepID=A0A1U7ZEB6_NELNU|nr:PREDICTED: pentatricopeptide repeat-containing protein At1g08070, chloroplastic-like [Nelumbo nucifera]